MRKASCDSKSGDAIAWLKSIPVRNRDRIFLIDDIEGSSWTFGCFDEMARAAAADLERRGFRKGDRVVLLLENSTVFSVLYFACLYLGLVTVPVNPGMSVEEVEFIIQDSRARVVVLTSEIRSKFKALPFSVKALVIGSEPMESGETWSMGGLPRASDFSPLRGITSKDDMTIVYTSGTTAQPKGVVHRISDLVENARLFGKVMNIGPGNRFLNLLAMSYLGGYYNLLLLPYLCESSVVLVPTFNAKTIFDFWAPVVRHQVNTLWLVPTIIAMLMEMDRGRRGEVYCRQNVRLALVGTAPLPDQMRRGFERRYGVKLHENFGLTETLFLTTTAPGTRNRSSAGKALPGVRIAVLDEEGNRVPAGDEGEIVVWTKHLMRGYLDSATGKPAKCESRRGFPTGDIGFSMPDGRLCITGRKKDLIIRGGINISPASIENLLYKSPFVVECAVVGVPHAILGEEICAVVRTNNSEVFPIVKSKLEELCRNHLSPIRQPTRIIELSTFPRTHSGKIQKDKIRAWIKNRGERDEGDRPPTGLQALPKKKGSVQPSVLVQNCIEAMSIEFNTMVYEMQRAGKDIVVLSLGEAFFDIPLRSFSDLPEGKIYHYSHSRGIPELRENIALYFKRDYKVAFNPAKEIIITAGSKIAIFMALMAILNQGDEVIVLEPAWVSFPEQIKLCGGVPVHVPFGETVFQLEKFITPRTKAIIINNPNNPSGWVYTLEELSHLHQLAERFNLFLLSDEAYSEFVLDSREFVSLGNLDPEKKHSIIVNSISKNFGISGWRLGYVITNAELSSQILKLNQHLITCAPTILAFYIAKHFFDIIEITRPQIQRVVETRGQVLSYMDRLGLKYMPGTATFYCFVSIAPSVLSSREFCARLLKEKLISAVPGIGYGKSCDRYIRLSVGTEPIERIRRALRTIREFIDKTSPPEASLAKGGSQ